MVTMTLFTKALSHNPQKLGYLEGIPCIKEVNYEGLAWVFK